jgi:YD repeat-containing protein
LGAQYTYDELNRVTKVQYEDGAIVQYAYDAVGNRLTKSATRPNHPPDAPSSPLPSDAARAISPRTTLSWTAADPDEGDSLTYGVYFGASNPPTTLVSSGQPGASFTPGGLDAGATYYWKIVAIDSHAARTEGPVWSFTTLAAGEDAPLSIHFEGGGSGSVGLSTGASCSGECTEMVSGGSAVTLTAEAATGSTFVSWSGCDSEDGDRCTLAMDGARSVSARFDIRSFTVTVSGSGNGSAAPASASVDYNGRIDIVITPDSGYTLDALLDNGVDATSLAAASSPTTFTYTLSAVAEEHNISVSFKAGEIPYLPLSVPALPPPALIALAAAMYGVAHLHGRTRRKPGTGAVAHKE